ncbi:MAG: right-handed parallel beta-helix repeat-containing protein, partial [Candidatus Cloacimonetes bacterium]|nr:right-handed parallel beta-helix repeat-containing protein [Candidatus Cloacimonadota bacterium]
MRKTAFLICRVVVLVFIIIKLSANLTYANIINVPGDYPTIQQGLDYAIAGDTVLVAAGIYVENIIWPAMNGIKLIGEAGKDSTIINGDSLASVIRFEEDLGGIIDGTTVIEGFTITNGNAQGDWPESNGGGIFCWESSPSLSNVTITSNTASVTNLQGGDGGGIYCNNSSPSLENVIITGNSATHDGGGISCYNSSPSLENVIITGNSATYRGGGINCWNNCSPSLENVTITGNSASYDGGGIYCRDNSSPSLVNCIFWNDSPQEIFFSLIGSPNSITIAYSDIQGGESAIVTNDNGTVNWLDGNIDADPLFADPESGDFHLTWANFPIHDPTKSPCIDTGDPSSSPDPDGTYADMGAFYFDQGPHIPPGDVSGIWTIDNSPYFIGGEINIPTDSTLVIEPGVQVIFSGHYKFLIYGRLLAEGAATDTIGFTAQDTTVGWHGLRFYDTDLNGQDSSKVVYCKLEYGKAIGNFPDNCGGAIFCYYSSDIFINNSIITNNTAFHGGGAYFYWYSSPNLLNVTISNNSAFSSGGGIGLYLYSSPSLTNVTISKNTTAYGGGIHCYNNCNPNLSNVTVSNNLAISSGGGIYCVNNANPSLVNSILWDNSPQEICFSVAAGPNSITIAYSDVEGDSAGIVTNNNGIVNWLDGNIDADPLFADPESGDFHLTWVNFPIHDSTKSPCIDTGDPSSSPDPDGTYADMGAFYFDQGPHIPPGDVSGTWNYANSPYYIGGEINIPFDSNLVIEPGVQVIFSGHYKFNIYGRLLAEGTATDTIVFTAQDTTLGWHGLRFLCSNWQGSKLVYCKLEYGRA